MGGRLFGGADHGSQNVGLERRAWPLAQAVSGSVGSQGTATNVPALRVGTDRSVLAIARAFSRWRSGLRWANATSCITALRPGSGTQRLWKPNYLSEQTGSSADAFGWCRFCQTLVSLTLARGEVPVVLALRLFLP